MKVAWKKIQSCHKRHQTVSQSPPIKQQALPPHLMVPDSLFPDEETLGGTVVPPENPKRNDRREREKNRRRSPLKEAVGTVVVQQQKQRLLYPVPAAAHKSHFVLQYFKSNNIPHE